MMRSNEQVPYAIGRVSQRIAAYQGEGGGKRHCCC